MYQYTATFHRVIDGDTVVADVDLGFNIRHRITARLDGINCPELPTREGDASRLALMSLVTGKTLEVRTIRDRKDKYGRWLLVIVLEDGVTTANQVLIDGGHALPYR